MKPCPEISQLVSAWFTAASEGDPSLVRERVHLGAETRLIGSDPGEWLEGGAAVTEFLKGELDGAGGRVRFIPTGVEAFCEGALGWAVAQLKIEMPDGKFVTPRWSAVFVLDNGVWKFAHIHASIGVRNAEVGWVYPDRTT